MSRQHSITGRRRLDGTTLFTFFFLRLVSDIHIKIILKFDYIQIRVAYDSFERIRFLLRIFPSLELEPDISD